MLELDLRPGDRLDARPLQRGWALERGTERLGRLLPPAPGTPATVTCADRSWRVTGGTQPLALTLWDDREGAGAAWCRAQPRRRGALVQVTGAEEDLRFSRSLWGGARLAASSGTVAGFETTGRDAEARLHLELADRPDVASFAGGVLLVALWLLSDGLATMPRAWGARDDVTTDVQASRWDDWFGGEGDGGGGG